CLNGSNLFFLIFLQKKSTDARDPELLAQHNITHILSIHDTAAPVLEGGKSLFVKYMDVDVCNSDLMG
uniref:Dual specificity phosphatase 22 n=1 Tax=Salarias fasciatus TaxID=181472 RepID=A0A672FEL1_SALFA